MSRAITVCYTDFGRINYYEHNRAKVLHATREGQILFLISGDPVTCLVNDESVQLTKECAITVDSFAPLEIKADAAATRSVILSVYVNPMWFATRFYGHPEWLRFSQPSVPITSDIRNHLDHLLALVQPPAPNKQPGYHRALDTRVGHLLGTCFSTSAGVEQGESPFESSDARVRKCLLIMNTHVKNVLPLDEIARASGLSRPHFYRLFRDNLGMTPNVYMNLLRMEYAVERLIYSDQPVTSIALELGFASQASFTRFFGANLGVPPTDYRRVAILPPGVSAERRARNQEALLQPPTPMIRPLGSAA